MQRLPVVLAVLASGLALFAGAATGSLGLIGFVGLVGVGIASAAFVDLRVTLLALVPAMVLLPELPLAIPLRTEDLLMVPLVAAWLARLALGRDSWPSTPLNRPLFALIVVELAALLWGAYRGTAALSPELYSSSFFFLKTVEVTFLYFIVVSAVRTEKDVRLFLYTLCGSAAVLGTWGVIERGSLAAGEAIIGPTGHGGYSLLGLTFVVLLSILMSLLVTPRSVRVRGLLAVAALPVIYSLTFTFSRQSYVGIIAALGVIIWFRDRRLILPMIALALVLPLLVPELVQERALSILPGIPDPASGVSAYATRLNALIQRIPEVALGSPLLGFGLASLPPGFLDNQYLLTFYYTGLIGLGVFLWLLWRALSSAHASYRTLSGDLKGLGLAWLAATVGLCLAGLAGSPFVAVRVREVYWVLAALAVAATQLASSSRGERGDAVAEEVVT